MRVQHIDPDHYWAEKSSAFVDGYLDFNLVAGILEVPEETLEIWFKGEYNFPEKIVYGPVIREFSTVDGDISWFGFIQAYLLKQLGADQAHRHDLHKIAEFFQKLEHHYQIHCPLGIQQTWSPAEFSTLQRFQSETDLPPQYCLITESNTKLIRTSPTQYVYDRIEWEGGWARRLILQHPPVPEDAPIYIHPFTRSGFPRIRHTDVVYLRNRVADWNWGDAEYMVGAFRDPEFTVSDVERAVAYALEHNLDHNPPIDGEGVMRYDDYDAMLAEQKAEQTVEKPELEPLATDEVATEERVLQPT